MQRGRDALSSVLIGFVLSKSLSDWLAFAHCCVNGWPAVTWQFVDPIISVCQHVDVCLIILLSYTRYPSASIISMVFWSCKATVHLLNLLAT